MTKHRMFIDGEGVEVGSSLLNTEVRLDREVFDDTSKAYLTGLRETTVDFSLNATPELYDIFAGPDLRQMELFYRVTHDWSRWRRWLNAILRFAWWPLGPPRLPVDYETGVMLPSMEITRARVDDEGVFHVTARQRPQEVRDGD